MRACVLAVCLLCCSPIVAAEQEFPYTAYITGHDVVVRSGPARRFYATDRMRRGEEVEIYQHEDRWCAVRPPQSSFSWVKSDELRIGTDGIALVLIDQAACRIGSSVSDLRDVIQVKLERGEEVEVLDAVRLGDGDDADFWCKISPPNGEFRWVHEDDVAREPPAIAEESLESAPRTDRWGSWVRSRRGGDEEANRSTASPADGYRRTGSGTSSQEIELVAGSREETEKAGGTTNAASSNYQIDRGASDSFGLTVNPALAAEIDTINLEVTRIVVDEPAKWQLADVRRRTDAALTRSQSALERGKVRLLLSRIEKFEEIRQRSLGLPPAPSTPSPATTTSSPIVATPSVLLPAAGGLASIPAATQAAGAAQFDGVGKLTRVLSQRPNAPRFALVNQQNDVVAFVSPAPGINLQPFEGQYVGVTGQRGYMPELKKAHLTAQRVAAVQMATTGATRSR